MLTDDDAIRVLTDAGIIDRESAVTALTDPGLPGDVLTGLLTFPDWWHTSTGGPNASQFLTTIVLHPNLPSPVGAHVARDLIAAHVDHEFTPITRPLNTGHSYREALAVLRPFTVFGRVSGEPVAAMADRNPDFFRNSIAWDLLTNPYLHDADVTVLAQAATGMLDLAVGVARVVTKADRPAALTPAATRTAVTLLSTEVRNCDLDVLGAPNTQFYREEIGLIVGNLLDPENPVSRHLTDEQRSQFVLMAAAA